MSTPKRNHLDAYEIDWYGPGGHESHKKVGGLNLLSLYISKALRKAKHVTEPAAHKIMVRFSDETPDFFLFQRHPKTVWLKWVRDYRDLEALPLHADNETIGEFSIQIAREFIETTQSHPDIIRGVPFDAIEQAISDFRASGYSFTSRLGPKKPFDASPLVARFFTNGNCLGTETNMVIFHGKAELHRQVVTRFGPGRWDLTKSTGIFDLYNEEIRFFSIDVLRPQPVIRYEDLPETVRKHLPSNKALHAEWRRQGF